jgi:hypothetical protein
VDCDVDCTGCDNCTCRLFHSTIRAFIVQNPNVLLPSQSREEITGSSRSSGLVISEDYLGDACLSYLSLPRYGALLSLDPDNSQWATFEGHPVERDHFLLYAARYGDRHFNSVDKSKLARNYKRILAFLKSPNFITCIQVQSLWIEYKFHTFTQSSKKGGNTVGLQRIFPRWFPTYSSEAACIWQDYRQLVHEWRQFLGCREGCGFGNYLGQVDRCWWNSLTANSFLAHSTSRYDTYRVESLKSNPRVECFEAVTADGSMKLLWIE